MSYWEASLGAVLESSEGHYKPTYLKSFLSGIDSTECKQGSYHNFSIINWLCLSNTESKITVLQVLFNFIIR